MTTNITIGQPVRDARDWNTLPIGAVTTDRDGWTFIKVRDAAVGDNVAQPHYTAAFDTPWAHGLVLTSLPEGEESEPEIPARPLVDFSTPSRATTREYASDLISRTHEAPTNDVLRRIAEGGEVDAYEIVAVLPDVFSVCATRAGQSMSRREFTKKARHIAYIANAVIQSHADGLPTYESGERSRKIATLEGEIAALRTAGADALREVELSTAALVEHRERADAEVTRLLDLASARDTLLAETVAERDNLQEVNQALTESLEYAMGLLATVEKGAAYQALGFMDAKGIEIN